MYRQVFPQKLLVIILMLGTALVFGTDTAFGSMIDFENFGPANTPLPEGTPLSSVLHSGITVTFSTEDAFGTGTPIIAEIGGPRVAFQSSIGTDTPENSSGDEYLAGGRYSLTDGIANTQDYIIEFSAPVENFSLDLYDFRADGPHSEGTPGSDTVVLEAYDALDNLLFADPYTVPDPRPTDGDVVNLGAPVSGIRRVVLNFSTIEGGTAIDNIRFTAVPEPSTMTIASIGLALIGLRRRRRSLSLKITREKTQGKKIGHSIGRVFI